MRYSPPIVPEDTDRDVYLVLEDFRPLGRCQRSLILAPADAAEEIACGGVARRRRYRAQAARAR